MMLVGRPSTGALRARHAAAALALVVAVDVLLPLPAHTRASMCEPGRFIVMTGGGLLTTAQSALPAIVIESGSGTVHVPGACGRVRARLRARKTRTTVRAVWKSACGTVGRRVRLHASVTAPSCIEMRGRLAVRGPSARTQFRAVRSTCGDGFVDSAAGEECEPLTGCEAGGECAADSCWCQPPVPAVTTTSPPTTAPQSTTTTSTTITTGTTTTTQPPILGPSVARQWNEELLDAIRRDTPRPTVHARNLFHLSAAMYDVWAAYQTTASSYLVHERVASDDADRDRSIAISYAAHHILTTRFARSPNATTSLASFRVRMATLGLDPDDGTLEGTSPVALGNRIGAAWIEHGLTDGSNEVDDYADPTYVPVNGPLVVLNLGTTMADPNRWQPLALDKIVTQNGIVLPDKVQKFIGSHWGGVEPFALPLGTPADPPVDPGPPPQLGEELWVQSIVEVLRLSSYLDPSDPTTIDVSPGAIGNNPLGTNFGTGHPINPSTGQPYAPNVVNRGDFGRVLAEYWADGPHSETPPGHWNVIANFVSDQPGFPFRIGGRGPELGRLEWDVKLYFALNGALHDAAIAAWGVKRLYDSSRPISIARLMAGRGQSSDQTLPSYHPDGLPLVPGLIELVTEMTTSLGARHEALYGQEGRIAVRAWPGEPADPVNDVQGARWVLAQNWVPYQKKTFVSPAFAGYTSGHSTFSRAAAEVMTRATGNHFFPGGLAEFTAHADAYLTFERGPSTTITLQWATYQDAADQAGQSRLWGGIHVAADDFAGRVIGSHVGPGAWNLALAYFDGTVGGD